MSTHDGAGVYVRGIHGSVYRSGEWAGVIGCRFCNGRPCLRVLFDDGKEDEWAVFAEPQHYEFGPKPPSAFAQRAERFVRETLTETEGRVPDEDRVAEATRGIVKAMGWLHPEDATEREVEPPPVEPEIDKDEVRRLRVFLLNTERHEETPSISRDLRRVAGQLAAAWMKNREQPTVKATFTELPILDDWNDCQLCRCNPCVCGQPKPAPGHCSPKPGNECVPPMERWCTRDVGCKDHPHRWDDGVWRAGAQHDAADRSLTDAEAKRLRRFNAALLDERVALDALRKKVPGEWTMDRHPGLRTAGIVMRLDDGRRFVVIDSIADDIAAFIVAAIHPEQAERIGRFLKGENP